MAINSIQSNNLGVIPQPAPQKPRQTTFAAGNTTSQPQYVLQRRRGIGSVIFDFATFLGGAFAGTYAARKLIFEKRPQMKTWQYWAISIPIQLVTGSITQALGNRLINKN